MQRLLYAVHNRPPGLSTRVISAIARSASQTKQSTVTATTQSKISIVEWQPFDLCFNELHLDRRYLDAALRGGDHRRVCVEPCYNCATPSQFQCKLTVAAAAVQQGLVNNWPNKLEEQLPLQCIGDLAEAA
jgi:hypothetical protein